MVLVSWQSLADTSALKKGIVLNNIMQLLFLDAQGLLASASQCVPLFKQ